MSVVANVAINVDSRGVVSKLKGVDNAAQKLDQTFKGVDGRLRDASGKFIKLGNSAQSSVGQLKAVQTQAQSTKRAFGGLQQAIGALGVGFALSKVISDVKELDTNLRRLNTVGGNVAALDNGLGDLSDRLDGVANKAELAAASYQALSAGFTETSANLRVVEAATKAAIGGMADITGVVDVTTKVLNAYNMSGDQATKVTDSISKAVELGQVQWSDYTSQLGRVASIAAIAGVSLDEVNAFVAAATKNGATAEVAFTGLGASLATIIKPTTESTKAAQALGINWTLAGLRGEGFESLMSQLAKAMASNTEKATEMVGGQEAVRGAFAAASKGGKDYAMILEGLGGATGKTDADFQTMKGSLENTLKALDTSFKNLSEALGKAFGPTVVIAVQDITKAVNGFADFMSAVPQPVMDTTGTIIKLVAQMLLLQKGIQGVIALKAGVAGMLAATAASATAAGTAAGGAATKVNMLKSAMLGLLKFAVVTLAVDVVISGLGKLAEVQARMNAITKGSTKQFAEQVGGSALSRQEIQNLKKQNREERARRVEEEKSVRFPMVTAQDDIARQAITQLDTRFAQLQTMGERAKFLTPADRALSDSKLTTTTGGGGAGKGKQKPGRSMSMDSLLNQKINDSLQLRLAQQETMKQRDLSGAQGTENEAQAKRMIEHAHQYRKALFETKALTAQMMIIDRDRSAFIASFAKDKRGDKAVAIDAKRAEILNQINLITQSTNTIAEEHYGKALEAQRADELILKKKLEDETLLGQQRKQSLTDELALAQARLTGNEAEVMLRMQIRDIMAGTAGLSQQDVTNTLNQINATKQLLTEKEKIKNLVQDIGASIEGGIVGAIDGAITGAKSLQESLADILKDIGKMLISFGIKSLLGGIDIGGTKIFGGGRAAGGPVNSNSTYMVGEKGPELFVPSTAGTIIPADATAAMARYQRQGGGDDEPDAVAAMVRYQRQGGGDDEPDAVAAMARYQRQGGGDDEPDAVAAMVRYQRQGGGDDKPDAVAAMARYQRQDGGMGGMGGNRNTTNNANSTTHNRNDSNSNSDTVNNIQTSPSPVLSLSFETTRFLGQDYVSTEQLQAAMMATEKRAAAAGAKAGAAQVTSKLQQSPAYRRQVGLR